MAKNDNGKKKKEGDGSLEKNDPIDKAKRQALELAIGQIEKKCGQGTIMRLGADTKVDVDVISTGSLSLDVATGIGGIPRGRVTEIFGPESSGKTTLALTVIAN